MATSCLTRSSDGFVCDASGHSVTAIRRDGVAEDGGRQWRRAPFRPNGVGRLRMITPLGLMRTWRTLLKGVSTTL